MVQFDVDFLGSTVVDKLFSNSMVPWVMADIQRLKKSQKVNLTINNGDISGEVNNIVIFRHPTQHLHRFCHEPNNVRMFMYLVRDRFEPVLNVYLFKAAESEDVMEIFQAVRDSTRQQPRFTQSNNSATNLMSLCPDISPTNSQFFEVLYVGKLKVSHRKVPDTFIDDALEEFRLYELEKSKKLSNHWSKGRKCSNANCNLKIKNCYNCNDVKMGNISIDGNVLENFEQISKSLAEDSVFKQETNFTQSNKKLDAQHENDLSGNLETNSIQTDSNKMKMIPIKEGMSKVSHRRTRTGALGVIETFKKKADDLNQNRTMLFYVGRTDLRLISPDRKQVLLHKMLKEINCCIQGIQNSHHFGIVSREIDGYFGYVFKCESNSVADNIVLAITQTFHSVREGKDGTKQPVLSCENCPMMWFHKLCAEIEEQNDKKRRLTILKKIETLPDDEQMDIHTKLLGAESSDVKEQNEFLMILLRKHCEMKQTRHVHDRGENRSEFLNQVLGGNTIFMKAKRSLTSSFDHLLKRKGSQADGIHFKEATTLKSDVTGNNLETGYNGSPTPYVTVGSADVEIMKREFSKHTNSRSQHARSLSKDKRINLNVASNENESTQFSGCFSPNDVIEDTESYKTPLRNIFLKVGNSSKTSPTEDFVKENMNQTPSGSWRQAIYNTVVTPGKMAEVDDRKQKRKTKTELRDLWKTAINQQILLIRMEKENARLKASQEEATVKRIKLEYDELSNAIKEQMGVWDTISNKENKISCKSDKETLFQAARKGVPRARRGDVWYYFAHQHCRKESPFALSDFPNYNVPYEDILKQLTSFQHTILIDLGRTFPNHPYFSSPLGRGQLALFNLLKAYSLLDPQVGYCQGLSFVAGVLLLHMSEEQAFLLLKYLMFMLDLRKQYLPDMAALQVQLYQLSRLIHDSLPKLYVHFDKNEIAPTLYAASWMLTLFASQFPLGFVARIFDLIFTEQTTDILFRVIMALLEEHKTSLLKLSNFEDIMDYLKYEIPKMDSICLEKLIKKILSMDISKQLREFEVEYHVLQEEISTPQAELDLRTKIEKENRKLTNENLSLQKQLETLTRTVSELERSRLAQQSVIEGIEAKTKSLKISINILGDFIAQMSENHNLQIPEGVYHIITNLDSLHKESVGRTVSSRDTDNSKICRKMNTTESHLEKKFCEVNDFRDGTKFGGKCGKCEVENLPIAEITLRNIQKLQDLSSLNVTKPSSCLSKLSAVTNPPNSNVLKNQMNQRLLLTEHQRSDSQQFEKVRENIRPKQNFCMDIGSLFIKEPYSGHKKEDLMEGVEKEYGDNQEVSSILQDVPLKVTTNNLHPKNTSNGVTTFKSLKVGHQRLIDLSPINDKLLHISEDGDI